MQFKQRSVAAALAAGLVAAACGSSSLDASVPAAGLVVGTSTSVHTTATTAAAGAGHTTATTAAGAGHGAQPGAAPASHGATPHWTYTGQTGAATWGALSEDWALCSAGVEQSPINVEAPTAAAPVPASGGVRFAYQPSAFEVVDNGHTIQVNLTAGGQLDIEGDPYTLVQFHAHAPSEHTSDLVQYPLEYHLVHKNAAGNLAVVGVFVQEGAAHQVWESIFSQLPAESGAKVAATGTIDATALLPAGRQMVRYDGSLTTPPCSEAVRWHVMVDPVTLSHAQLATFTTRYPYSNRPLQARNTRTLEVVTAG
ncbi:MAG: carbonic anhydrase [Acidimicrobiales bacterium]